MAITLVREEVDASVQLSRMQSDESFDLDRAIPAPTVDLTRDQMQGITLLREEG